MAFHWIFLALFFLFYVSFFGLIAYVCIFANPETSPMAYTLTVSLPQRLEHMLISLPWLGAPMVAAFEFLAQHFLMLLYLIIVLGCWSIIFTYVYPWIDLQYSQTGGGSGLSPTFHQSMGYLVFLLCLGSWWVTRRTSPGIITPTTRALYQHYPFDDGMYTHSAKQPLKLARSKFDRMKYQHFVPRYDHYCGWVDNTIGEENYRHFLAFLLIHTAMCYYGTYVLGFLYHQEIQIRNLLQVTFFDRASGQEVPSSRFIAWQYLFYRYLYESIVFVILIVMAITLTLFLGYHIYITSYGLTSNETYKWSQIRKWYRAELQRYEQQYPSNMAAGMPPPRKIQQSANHGATRRSTTTKTTGANDTGDDTVDVVTCIPPTTASDIQGSTKTRDDDGILQHPGPPPINIYNRGFIENWCQVLDPIPCRKRRRRQNSRSH